MNESTRALLTSAVDSVVADGESGSVDRQAAFSLYKAAYGDMPSGGYPHIDNHSTTYLDGSTVNSSTRDGVTRVQVDEKGKSADCKSKAGNDPWLNIQKVYECMYKAHGSVIADKSHFDNGSGLTMDTSSSEYTLGSWDLGQKSYTTDVKLKASPDLTLDKRLDGDKEQLTVSHQLQNGASERVTFDKTPWYKRADIKLHSVEVVGKDGKVRRSRTIDQVVGR